MRSPFLHEDSTHYQGGKGLAFRHVINLMPPHRRYIETHLGGGAVVRKKRPAIENIGIDKDPNVLDLWRRRGVPHDMKMICGDATSIIAGLELDHDDLLYCDPPYPKSTRGKSRPYRFDMDDEDHVNLLETLLRLPAMVMISSYDNEVYRQRLVDWHRHSFETLTHGGMAREHIWTNFEPGPELHDYRYVGDDFRERERRRRRRASLVKKLVGIEEVELNAVLAEIAAKRPEAVLAAGRSIP